MSNLKKHLLPDEYGYWPTGFLALIFLGSAACVIIAIILQ